MHSRSILAFVAVALSVLAACAQGGGPVEWDVGSRPMLSVPASPEARTRMHIAKWNIYRFRDGLSIVAIGLDGELQRNVRYRYVATGTAGTALAVESLYPERAHSLILATGELRDNTFGTHANALATLAAVQHDLGDGSSIVIPYAGGCDGALAAAGGSCAPSLGGASAAVAGCTSAVAGSLGGGSCTATSSGGCPSTTDSFLARLARAPSDCASGAARAYAGYGSCASGADSAAAMCGADPGGTGADPGGMGGDPSAMGADPGTATGAEGGAASCFESSGSACCDSSSCGGDPSAGDGTGTDDPSRGPTGGPEDPSMDPSRASGSEGTSSDPGAEPAGDPGTNPGSEPEPAPETETPPADDGAGGDDGSGDSGYDDGAGYDDYGDV